MNAHLVKAEAALAADRKGEASVHAWNAIATVTAADTEDIEQLVAIARQLEDDRLVQELQRRGFARAVEQYVEKDTSPRRGIARYVFPVVVVSVLLFLVSETVPLEAGPLQADRSTPPVLPPIIQAQPPLQIGSQVALVPISGADRVDLQRLADELFLRYRVPVMVQAGVDLREQAIDRERGHVIAEELIETLARAYVGRRPAAIIGVTDYDMYLRSEDTEHAFVVRSGRRYAVVSTSELGASIYDRLRGRSRHERARKLVGRAIAFEFLGRPQVEDPHSLMRPRMSGVEDIDALEEKL